MAQTIKYIGTNDNWFEVAVTGKQSNWQIGQMEERSDSEAALLLATGLFETPLEPVMASKTLTGVVEKIAGDEPLFEVEPVSVDQRDTSGRWTLCTYRGVQYTATYGQFGFSTIAAGGYVWTYNYDAAGRLTSITRA